MTISIEEFYQNNQVDDKFDEIFYQGHYPQTQDFYQPHCKDNHISDKYRLYYHYVMYGKDMGFNIKPKYIYLKPTQGLCNRLLLIDSVVNFATTYQFHKIKICWVSSSGFSNESFDKLFDCSIIPSYIEFISEQEYSIAASQNHSLEKAFMQNLDSLEYIFNVSKIDTFAKLQQETFCYHGYASLYWIFNTLMSKDALGSFIKKYIKPHKNIQKKIDALDIDRSFVGVHIRRGDALNSPWSFNYLRSDIDSFNDIIDNSKSRIFLATDCEATQNKIIQEHTNKIVFNEKQFLDPSLSIKDCKEKQQDAVIDLFCLSKTGKIFGNNWSTFSQVASLLNDTPIHYVDKNFSYKPIPDLCAIVGLKNRNTILKTSIHSWLCKPEIKQIIIVDCDSGDFDYSYFSNLDNRIKIISINNQPYFNLSTVYNKAIEYCSYDHIIKLDVDYLLNPYIDLWDWIHIDWDKQFLTGDWSHGNLDNNIGLLEYLNGFICIKKEHLINVGGYRGNKYGYGYDDCDLYNRLEKQLNLSRQIIDINQNSCPIIHLPHSHYYRTCNYQEKNHQISWQKNHDQSVANNLIEQ